jgi:hypothetical protein
MTDSLFISIVCIVVIIQVLRVTARCFNQPLTDKQLAKRGLKRLPPNADQLEKIMTPEAFHAMMQENLFRGWDEDAKR